MLLFSFVKKTSGILSLLEPCAQMFTKKGFSANCFLVAVLVVFLFFVCLFVFPFIRKYYLSQEKLYWECVALVEHRDFLRLRVEMWVRGILLHCWIAQITMGYTQPTSQINFFIRSYHINQWKSILLFLIIFVPSIMNLTSRFCFFVWCLQ